MAALADRGRLRIGLVVVGALCAASILLVDRPLALFLHAALSEDARAVFHLTSKFGEGGPWYGAAVLVLLAAQLGRRYSRTATGEARWWRARRAALFFITAHLASGLCVLLLKVSVGRLRPRFLFNEGLYGFDPLHLRVGEVCFPSGHTQTITTALVALAFILPYRRVVVPMAALALLVGASRLLVGAHFLADVMMAAYVGTAATVLVHRAYKRWGWNIRIFERG
jgi:membrane-associated phospholipid phosphatase